MSENETNEENGQKSAIEKSSLPPGASPINGQVPPPEHRFSSANQPERPGRKKGIPNIKTVFEKLLAADISATTRTAIERAMGEPLPKNVDYLTAIALGQINKAIANRDTKSAEFIADRLWGKPQQKIIEEQIPADVRDGIDYDALSDEELDEVEKAMETLEKLKKKRAGDAE